jgi:lycopene cyclase domain-containing protein
MTYLQFHFVFTLPALFILKLVGPRVHARDAAKAVFSLVVIAVIAFVYTTPWDNYLVSTGVWGYGPGRVLATVGHVPVEEYMFFVIQPLLTGLLLFRLLWSRSESAFVRSEGAPSPRARWIGTAGFVAASLVGAALLAPEPTRYLALILVWACPVLAVQWAYGGHHLWRLRRVVAVAVAAPTLYLWVADRIALALGIWHISDRFTTGLALFGLPIEEALFFLVTNMLVVQGLVLALHTLKVDVVQYRPDTARRHRVTA